MRRSRRRCRCDMHRRAATDRDVKGERCQISRFFLFFSHFFLLPRLILHGRRRSKSGRKQPQSTVLLGSGRSMHRSAGGLVHTAQYVQYHSVLLTLLIIGSCPTSVVLASL
ncbi:hypothetical protein BHE74_00016099 [Ensete ventricosum]|nr:hypothetical protein GW17_00036168 [Ensete ventricosum]RWW75859.1 hypothetical protein BHE74_00016099 [Ensete ventricosum]RZS07924.1 hypothetical protein BHM03_00038833 [Ensete ventricosum]